MITIEDFVPAWGVCGLADPGLKPWDATGRAAELVQRAIGSLSEGYLVDGDTAVHATAIVEAGAIIKGPAILGPRSFVAAGAYLRGGVFLEADCVVGPACELKTTFMFRGSKIAHLSFVGDSIVGARVNLEAGAVVANYRNEMDDKRIRILWQQSVIDTGVEKFGALIGDDVRIGANAVVAPGALLRPGFRLARLGMVDQHPNGLR